MAMPDRFYYNEIAKASDYLHYWYANSYAHQDIQGIINTSLDQIGLLQLQNFRQKQKNSFKNGDSQAISELLSIFDASVYQKGIDSVLEPYQKENPDIGLKDIPLYSLDNIDKLLEELKSLNTEQLINQLSDFAKKVEEIVDIKFSPSENNQTIKEVAKGLFFRYAQKTGNTTADNIKNFSKLEQSQTANSLIKDVLTNSHKKIIQVTKGVDDQNLTNTLKKMLLAVEALRQFDTNTEFGKIEVKHTSKKSRDKEIVETHSEVFEAFAKKIIGAISTMRFNTYEKAVKKAALDGNIKFLEEYLGIKIDETKTVGSNSFKVKQSIDNSTFERILKESTQEQRYLERGYSKADVQMKANRNGIEMTLGFSIKGGKDVEVNVNSITGLQTANITLQNNTPLSTLLFREIGLNSQQYHSVLQLLVGHELPNENLDRVWENIKIKLQYMALLSALTGYHTEGQALMMVIGDRVISMDNLLLEIYTNPEKIYSIYFRDTNKTGGLNRSTYEDTNIWIPRSNEKDGPDNQIGYERSNRTWSRASQILYDTKINIILKTSDLQQLLSI